MDSLRNRKEAGFNRRIKKKTCVMKPQSKARGMNPKLNLIGSLLDCFSLDYVVIMM